MVLLQRLLSETKSAGAAGSLGAVAAIACHLLLQQGAEEAPGQLLEVSCKPYTLVIMH